MRLMFYRSVVAGHEEAFDLDTGLIYTKFTGNPDTVKDGIGISHLVQGRAYGRMPLESWEVLIREDHRARLERSALVSIPDLLAEVAFQLARLADHFAPGPVDQG